MKFEDYQKLYENLDKYNNEITHGDDLKHEIFEWKIPNLESVIPKGLKINSIAEVGCFSGDLVANITINNENIQRTGYDCNSKAIELAKSKYPKIDFVIEDITNSFSHYDLVILSDIIEHIKDDEAFLNNLSKNTKALLINLPLEKCWANLFREYGINDSSGHMKAYSYEDAIDLFNKTRWKVINYKIKWFCETEIYNQLNFKDNSFLKKKLKNIVLNNKYLRRKYFPSNLFAFLLRDA